MNPRMRRCLLAMVLMTVLGPVGCGPDHPETSVDIPPRGASPSPDTPGEPQYQKETPKQAVNDPDNPCSVVIEKARLDFGKVYEISGRPRMAILANVLSTNLGGRDDDQARVTSTLQPAAMEAVPVDRATVENECMAFFNSTTDRMKLVDVAVARTSMASATSVAGILQGFRRIDLCDIAIMIEIRVNRVEPSQDHAGNPERFTIACTTRAANVRDGRVLATRSAERRIATSEQDLNSAMRRMSLCLAAELSTDLGEKLMRPPP